MKTTNHIHRLCLDVRLLEHVYIKKHLYKFYNKRHRNSSHKQISRVRVPLKCVLDWLCSNYIMIRQYDLTLLNYTYIHTNIHRKLVTHLQSSYIFYEITRLNKMNILAVVVLLSSLSVSQLAIFSQSTLSKNHP